MQTTPSVGDLQPVIFDNDAGLLTEVLAVYKPHCRYLKSVALQRIDGATVGRCRLAIPESCYIDDTGHFNCVEFNICYNQMSYYLLAKAVKEKLLPELVGWSIQDYWSRQLSDMFISRFECEFRKPMKSADFSGEIRFLAVRSRPGGPQRQPLVWIDTICTFWDDNGGNCRGRVLIALTNPPAS
jgi:hypothetical protein